ncbi:MAG: outer membrane beta-barrel family protein [Bacteroidaceae bacterium]|nr:outer membrane beta-barrel family protein [Bacteroidaceae bacterium]
MKKNVIIAALLAVSNVAAVWADTTSDCNDVIGLDASVSSARSVDIIDHAEKNGRLDVNFINGRSCVFAGFNVISSYDNLKGDYSSESDSDLHFDSHGHIARGIESTGYGLKGGANWLLDGDGTAGFNLKFNTVSKKDIHDKSYLSVSKIDEMAKSSYLMDSIHCLGTQTVGEAPIDLNANLFYFGHVGDFVLDFNTVLFMNRDADENYTDEEDLDHHARGVFSGNMEKNRMLASKLVVTRAFENGFVKVGGEASFSYHYSDYYLLDESFMQNTLDQNEVLENNVRANIGYGLVQDRYSIVAGLEYEHYGFSFVPQAGNSRNLDLNTDKVYPSVTAQFDMGRIPVALSYSSFTKRPAFSQYNEAVRYGNRYMFRSGSSELRPQYVQNLKMTAAGRILEFAADYSYSDNPIVQTFGRIDTESPYYSKAAIIEKPANGDKPLQQLSMSLTVREVAVGDKLDLCWQGGVRTQWFEYSGNDYSDKPIWFANLNNSVSLSNTCDAELGFSFQSSGYESNMYYENNCFDLNMAVQKHLLANGALVVRLEGKDLLHRTDRNICYYGDGFRLKTGFVADSRRIELSLRYCLNAVARRTTDVGAGRDVLYRMK